MEKEKQTIQNVSCQPMDVVKLQDLVSELVYYLSNISNLSDRYSAADSPELLTHNLGRINSYSDQANRIISCMDSIVYAKEFYNDYFDLSFCSSILLQIDDIYDERDELFNHSSDIKDSYCKRVDDFQRYLIQMKNLSIISQDTYDEYLSKTVSLQLSLADELPFE